MSSCLEPWDGAVETALARHPMRWVVVVAVVLLLPVPQGAKRGVRHCRRLLPQCMALALRL